MGGNAGASGGAVMTSSTSGTTFSTSACATCSHGWGRKDRASVRRRCSLTLQDHGEPEQRDAVDAPHPVQVSPVRLRRTRSRFNSRATRAWSRRVPEHALRAPPQRVGKGSASRSPFFCPRLLTGGYDRISGRNMHDDENIESLARGGRRFLAWLVLGIVAATMVIWGSAVGNWLVWISASFALVMALFVVFVRRNWHS